MLTQRKLQLRSAKRRQRLKERDAGLDLYQIRLPVPICNRLRTGMQDPEFVQRLQDYIAHEIIEAAVFPNLALLIWNRDVEYLTRKDAFQLYERNWRHIDEKNIPAHERALIDQLNQEFGRGVINA